MNPIFIKTIPYYYYSETLKEKWIITVDLKGYTHITSS